MASQTRSGIEVAATVRACMRDLGRGIRASAYQTFLMSAKIALNLEHSAALAFESSFLKPRRIPMGIIVVYEVCAASSRHTCGTGGMHAYVPVVGSVFIPSRSLNFFSRMLVIPVCHMTAQGPRRRYGLTSLVVTKDLESIGALCEGTDINSSIFWGRRKWGSIWASMLCSVMSTMPLRR